MKQPKIIIQQPKKSKAADRTLQLDLIERHVLHKIFSQRHKIKTKNSKKYNDQINLARSSIKNNLFEITKEFNKFKFRQNL